MSNFKEILDLPIYDLYSCLNKLIEDNTIQWSKDNQICLNSTNDHLNDFTFGGGSLTQDWSNVQKIKDEFGNEKIHVPLFKNPYTEDMFTELCSQFIGTPFEIVYNQLKVKYKLGRVRLMKSKPKTCLSWHIDVGIRIHYPIKTQVGCFMVIEDEVKHLYENKWYWTNTNLPHTAFNASKEDRIHLVATIL